MGKKAYGIGGNVTANAVREGGEIAVEEEKEEEEEGKEGKAQVRRW